METNKSNGTNFNGTTFAQLRDYILEKFKDQDKLDEIRGKLYDAQFKAISDQTALALASAKEAVSKAEASNDKRFESVNEFRNQQKDIIDTFARKNEVGGEITRLNERIATIDKSLAEEIQQINNHLQLPLHAGSQQRIDNIEIELREIRGVQIKLLGEKEGMADATSRSHWTIERIITIIFGLVGVAALIHSFLVP